MEANVNECENQKVLPNIKPILCILTADSWHKAAGLPIVSENLIEY